MCAVQDAWHSSAAKRSNCHCYFSVVTRRVWADIILVRSDISLQIVYSFSVLDTASASGTPFAFPSLHSLSLLLRRSFSSNFCFHIQIETVFEILKCELAVKHGSGVLRLNYTFKQFSCAFIVALF